MAFRPLDLSLYTNHAPRGRARTVVTTPLAAVASLRFALPRAASGNVRVLDDQGNVVRTLLETTVPAGEHHVCWDGLAECGARALRGVYRLRLEVEGRTLTSRVVEIR